MTVKGWEDAQIFSWLKMLGQYDEGKDGQQRQLKDKEGCGAARNKNGENTKHGVETKTLEKMKAGETFE